MKTKLFSIVLLLMTAVVVWAQLPASLYIVGNAAPTGWHVDKSLKLDNVSSGVYKYSGPLFAGEYKFVVNQNSNWSQDAYVRDGSDPTKVVKNGPDNKWTVSALAQFDVTVNLNSMSIAVVQTSTVPSYSNFWLIGDVLSDGWNMDNVINRKFTQNPSNPDEFYYQTNFNAGEFKIFMGAFNDFNGSFYMPMSNHQDLSNYSAQAVNNPSFDYKWKIASAGMYSVVINKATNTVKVLSGTYLAAGSGAGKNSFQIFPNPVKGTLYIQSGKSLDGASAEIFSLDGKKVKQSVVSQGKLNTSDLKSGAYLLTVKNGSDFYSSKLIVE